MPKHLNLQMSIFSACGVIFTSWYAVGSINAWFRWFAGNEAIAIGTAYVVINAIITGVLRYRTRLTRQTTRQRLLEEMNEQTGEQSDMRPMRLSYRPKAHWSVRLWQMVRLIVGIAALYATLSLFGAGILFFGVAVILALVVMFLVQRRVITRLSPQALGVVAVVLLLLAVGGQIYRIY